MANYEPHARSNYFAVKNVEAFTAFCARWGLELIQEREQAEQKGPLVGFLCDSEQGIPTTLVNEDTGFDDDVDFIGELSQQLADGAVAVVMEAGYEKMRYLAGYAVAVNAAGEQVSINLHEIYDRAKGLGVDITTCAY